MYHILICDDEQDIVNALKIYLMNPDFKLFEANTGVQALEVMEREDIHLILLDIMMPEMDGISAMVKIREKSNVPIILLTAKSEDTVRSYPAATIPPQTEYPEDTKTACRLYSGPVPLRLLPAGGFSG